MFRIEDGWPGFPTISTTRMVLVHARTSLSEVSGWILPAEARVEAEICMPNVKGALLRKACHLMVTGKANTFARRIEADWLALINDDNTRY